MLAENVDCMRKLNVQAAFKNRTAFCHQTTFSAFHSDLKVHLAEIVQIVKVLS